MSRAPVALAVVSRELERGAHETELVCVCDDGAVFAATMNGHDVVTWYDLPPIPGTVAANS